MGKFSDIELLYLSEVLDTHGEYLTDLLRDKLETKRIYQKGELLNSIDYSTTKEMNNPVLRVNFFGYGRAIEIAFHKQRNNSSIDFKRRAVGKEIWGQKQKVKKKNTRWYARTVWGSLNRLIMRISSEFTEQEQERLKNILNNQKIYFST